MATNSFHCPNCGSADTQKSSLAYENGLSDINTRSTTLGLFSGRGGLGLGAGRTKTKGSAQTKLSQKTAPPAKKRYVKPLIFIILAPTLLNLILHLLPINIPNNIGNGLMTFENWAIPLACVAWIYVARSYNTKQWPSLKSIWDKAFICLRCDNQFVMDPH